MFPPPEIGDLVNVYAVDGRIMGMGMVVEANLVLDSIMSNLASYYNIYILYSKFYLSTGVTHTFALSAIGPLEPWKLET